MENGCWALDGVKKKKKQHLKFRVDLLKTKQNKNKTTRTQQEAGTFLGHLQALPSSRVKNHQGRFPGVLLNQPPPFPRPLQYVRGTSSSLLISSINFKVIWAFFFFATPQPKKIFFYIRVHLGRCGPGPFALGPTRRWLPSWRNPPQGPVC